jgi:hypothetical protein
MSARSPPQAFSQAARVQLQQARPRVDPPGVLDADDRVFPKMWRSDGQSPPPPAIRRCPDALRPPRCARSRAQAVLRSTSYSASGRPRSGGAPTINLAEDQDQLAQGRLNLTVGFPASRLPIRSTALRPPRTGWGPRPADPRGERGHDIAAGRGPAPARRPSAGLPGDQPCGQVVEEALGHELEARARSG